MAALVAADTLGQRGERVRLLLPGRGVGGGFAALRRDGRTPGLGVRLLELSDEGDEARCPRSRPTAPAATARMCAASAPGCRSWWAPGSSRPAAPRWSSRARSAPTTSSSRSTSRRCAACSARRRPTPWPPRCRPAGRGVGRCGRPGADRAAQLDGLTLEQASLANHGEGFHRRVVAPLCDKARRRRRRRRPRLAAPKGLGAVFHPRTLLQALRGEPLGFRRAPLPHGGR